MEVTRTQAAIVIGAVLVAAGVAIPLLGAYREEEGIANANEIDHASPDGESPAAVSQDGWLHPAGAAPAPAPEPSAAAAGPKSAEPAAPKRRVLQPDTGLGMRVHILDRAAADGQPVNARIRIENVGRNPVTVCDPGTDIARRVELLYRWRNVNYCATFPKGPVQPLDSSSRVEIAPGRAIETIVDLRPLFDQALGFGEGPFRFRLAWRGEPSAVPDGVRAWNADPKCIATSEEMSFEAPVPGWFAELGGDGDLLNGLGSRISVWTPGSPEDDAVLAHVRGLGAPAVAALAIQAGRMGGPEPGAAPRARKSVGMLRQLGAECLETLRKAPRGPARDMAIRCIEEDVRDAAGEPPSAESQPFRAIGGGAPTGTTFSVSAMRQGVTGSVTYSLDASGAVYVTRWRSADRRDREVVPLGTDQIVGIKRSILRARPWIWEPVRERRRAGEGDVTFSLSDPAGEMTWMAALRGDEARRGNPFAADVLRAFRIAAGDPDEPEPAEPPPPPRREPAPKQPAVAEPVPAGDESDSDR